MRSTSAPGWRSPDVLAISFSAFFADLGYQAVLAGFPLFLVLELHAPVWLFGLATALSYGGGAFVGYLGGRLGDREGHRRVAICGNAFIPLLSLSALVPAASAAVPLLTLGWWARNLRTPSRRVMLTRIVAPVDQGAAFGFLHALDIGGGMLAAVYVLLAVLLHAPWRWVFLGTILPLAASTYALTRTHATPSAQLPGGQGQDKQKGPQAGFRSLLLATALYGFSSYSVGFPVLTVAEGAHSEAAGITAFLVMQGVSAVTGYLLGGRLGRSLVVRYRNLSLWGYLAAGLGSAVLAVAYALRLGAPLLYFGIILLGFAIAVVETLEPPLIAALGPAGREGHGFGMLTASRSVGLFVANLALGLLYALGAAYAYGYAAVVACVAAVLLIIALPKVRRDFPVRV